MTKRVWHETSRTMMMGVTATRDELRQWLAENFGAHYSADEIQHCHRRHKETLPMRYAPGATWTHGVHCASPEGHTGADCEHRRIVITKQETHIYLVGGFCYQVVAEFTGFQEFGPHAWIFWEGVSKTWVDESDGTGGNCRSAGRADEHD